MLAYARTDSYIFLHPQIPTTSGNTVISRCLLHIGTEKTGTTTIQSFLAKNRAGLLSQGVIYPSAPGAQNHMALTACCLEDSKIDDVRIVCGIRRPQAVEKFRTKLLGDLDSEIAKSDASTVVFSNEHLSSRLRTRPEIQRIKELCGRYARETKVIVYLRNQVDFLVSSYGTAIMSGETRGFPFPLRMGQLRALDYSALLRSWHEIFGKENIIVRRFEPADFPQGDLLLDFAALIPFEAGEFVRPHRLNESLDIQGIAFLREFNKHVPRIVNGRLNPLRGEIVKALRIACRGDRLTVPPDIATAIEEQFRNSNDNVSNDFFDGRFAPLFPPARSVGQSSLESLQTIDVSSAINIAAQLWIQRQRQMLRQQRPENEPPATPRQNRAARKL